MLMVGRGEEGSFERDEVFSCRPLLQSACHPMPMSRNSLIVSQMKNSPLAGGSPKPVQKSALLHFASCIMQEVSPL